MPTILIVTDDAAVTAVTAAVLTRSGYETFGASTGEEALRKVSRRRFDLMLIDLALGGDLDSEETIRGIRSLANGVTTPMLGLESDEPRRVRAPRPSDVVDIAIEEEPFDLRGTLVGSLRKPIDVGALEHAVAQILLTAPPATGATRRSLDKTELYDALSDLAQDAPRES